MSAKSLLQRLERRYAWSFLGFLLAVVGIVLAALSMRERRPEITFTVLSDSNVLDVHTPLPFLDVLYRGQSLQRANLNLKAILLRVENTGDVDILQTFYDSRLPWGFKFANGQVVDIRVVGGEPLYVTRGLQPCLLTDNSVSFEKIILDRGSYVVVQTLVLHKKESAPTLVPLGKIAGLTTFKTSRLAAQVDHEWWSPAFGGGSVTQTLRFLGYGLAFLTTIIVGLSATTLSEMYDRRRRHRRLSEIDAVLTTFNTSKSTRALLRDAFVTAGKQDFVEFVTDLHDSRNIATELDRMEKRSALYRERVQYGARPMDYDDLLSEDTDVRAEQHFVAPTTRDRLLRKFLAAGVIKRVEGRIEVDAQSLRQLEDLVGIVC